MLGLFHKNKSMTKVLFAALKDGLHNIFSLIKSTTQAKFPMNQFTKTAIIVFTKPIIELMKIKRSVYYLLFLVFLSACTETPVFVAPKPIETPPLDVMIKHIHATPEWIGGIEKTAREKQLNKDSLVLENALWMLDEQRGKHK